MATVKNLIQEYFKTTRMMQIATSVNGKPWCCTVYFAYDKDWNLYWISKPTDRHSNEIDKNKYVSGAIAYDQNPPRKLVRGVQFEGIAELLTGKAEEAASIIYVKQLNRENTLLEDIRSGKNPFRFYRIKPKKFVLFDRENFPINDERKEYKIK